MSEEDDWFERALRETDEESDEPPVEDEAADDGDGGAPEPEANDGAAGADDAEPDHDVGDDGPGDADGVPDDPARAIGIGTDDEGGDDDEEGEDDASGGDEGVSGDPLGGDGTDEDQFGGPEETGDDPFGGSRGGPAGDDSGSDGVPAGAFGDVDADAGEGEFGSFGGDGSFGDDDPFGGGGDAASGAESDRSGETGGSGGTDPFGDDDPFGGSRGGGSSGGGGASGAESPGGSAGDAGADPFGGYRGSAARDDDEFGFDDLAGGEAGPGEATDFDVDPDEFESEIDRTDIGIEGLDDMILGGVPSRSLLSVIGGAGTGKTTFALQFLNHALEAGNKGIYITLEQTRESIYDTAEEKGWSFREHADADRLAVVAIDPIEMANSLSSIRNDLVRLIAEFDADRLVLDSVSLLEMMYDHPAKRRSEVFGFTRSLKEAGVTTLLTSEASEETPYASRHGIVEYLTDAVFVLQYVRGSDFRETRLAVEIQKIRDANHSRETKPYDITDTGISVYDQANIF